MTSLVVSDPGPAPLRPVRSKAESDALPFGDLSAWFNPFLRHFMREALDSGGGIRVAEEDERVVGLEIFHPIEGVASIFTRSRDVAEQFRRTGDRRAVFCEMRLDARDEVYRIYSTSLVSRVPEHGFAHRVRIATRSEMPAVVERLREAYGNLDERWFFSLTGAEETCFIVEVGGTLAGAGWASVVDEHGRLHSLAVAPRYRRLGIGTDLLFARIRWARHAGATDVLSEISEHNVASRRIAERGGMRPVGEIFLSHPA